MPVFGIVLIGYLLGGRLRLHTDTLTRAAYYVFVPAFIFEAISGSTLPLDHTAKMVIFIVVTHLIVAVMAGATAHFIGHSREMTAAFIMTAVAGNVGNYGLALIGFRLGEPSLVPATIYYVSLSITIFIVCVGVADWSHGGKRGALAGLMKTPAIWAIAPALGVSGTGTEVPVMISRMLSLLADAMIPVMLFALGLQLLEQGRIHLSRDVFTASAFRLVMAPALACLVALPFGLTDLEFAAGVFQAGMPTAIIAVIIAREKNVAPDFVTSVTLVTVVASLATLPILMVMF